MIDINNYIHLNNFLSMEDKKILRIVNKLLKNIFNIEKIKIDFINIKYRRHKDYCKNIFCENNDKIEICTLFPEIKISKYPFILNKYCMYCINKYIIVD